MSTTAIASTLTVLIVEDDPMMQVGLSTVISQQTHLTVAAKAENGVQGVQESLRLKPDIVVMDIGLPELDGIEATKQIKAELPDTRVLILTACTDRQQVLAAFASGADAYCVKGATIEQLKAALTAASEGSVYLDARIADCILKQQPPHSPLPQGKPENFGFNKRELEIVELIAEGYNNSEIGAKLNLSTNTIKGYVRQIFAKLQVNSRTKAALKAWHCGLVKPEL
ncbi:MAG: response regulator transcription factor [Cyanobacteria bacterium P01_E01_bin.42]